MKLCKVTLACLLMVIAASSSAEIRRADMNRKVMASEGQIFMTQVDIVSLYLSSERIAYEPQLGPDQKILVDVTVLSPRLMEDRNAMRDFISRQITVFKRELATRIGVAAPAIAKNFNPEQDLLFKINEGATRIHVADMNQGEWTWIGGSVPPPVATVESKGLSEARTIPPPEPEMWCNCPALVRKK